MSLVRISRLDMGGYFCIANNSIPPAQSKAIKVSVDCKYHSATNTIYLYDVSVAQFTPHCFVGTGL